MSAKGWTWDQITERRQRVAELTRAGLSAQQIAAQLRTTSRTVCRDRSALGIAQPRPVRLTAEQLRRATEMLDDGASASEVARTIGCSQSAVINRFPGRGWTPEQISAHGVLCRQMQRHLR